MINETFFSSCYFRDGKRPAGHYRPDTINPFVARVAKDRAIDDDDSTDPISIVNFNLSHSTPKVEGIC